MKKAILVLLVSAFACGSAMAQSCATKAVGKDGKALAGAAKTSFIKKCCEDLRGRQGRQAARRRGKDELREEMRDRRLIVRAARENASARRLLSRLAEDSFLLQHQRAALADHALRGCGEFRQQPRQRDLQPHALS